MVFPAPKKPVITVMGVRSAAVSVIVIVGVVDLEADDRGRVCMDGGGQRVKN